MAKAAKRRRKRAVNEVRRVLPARLERLPLVRSAMRALGRGEERILALTGEGRRELNDAMIDLEARVQAEVEVVRRGVDQWLDRVGLVRKRRHLELLQRARRRAKSGTRKTGTRKRAVVSTGAIKATE